MQPPDGERYRTGEWWLCHAKTAKPVSRLTIEAPRGLEQGLAAFATTHQWEGQVLHVESIGCPPFGSRDVFVVHGHLQSAKVQLAMLSRSLGLNQVVLEEQPHRGRTIEKDINELTEQRSHQPRDLGMVN
jgi:hypothetical protein